MTPSSVRIPTIYTLPKIHKDPLNPPARPIVNGIGSVTSRLGQYLDQFLQGSVQKTRAYLKDTKDLLQSLQSVQLSGKNEVYLVTADVTSLYTVIQHDDALLALNWTLSQRDDLPHHQKVFLRDVLDFCLSHNYFWFDNRFYTQKKGVAMGAKFAPSIANLFMGEFEDKFVFFNRRVELLFYRRFIDDVLFLWEGSLTSLETFLIYLNENSNNIKLISHYSKEKNRLFRRNYL